MNAHLRGRPSGPAHNLFGDLGPRCEPCSGLGHVLALNPGATVRATSRCACKGTGVDRDAVRQSEFDALTRRIQELERLFIERHRVTSRKPREPRNSRQFWQELIAWATADGTAVANTTTEAIIFPNVTIPANYMQDGRILRAVLRGRWSNVVTAVPSVTWAVRWGGVSGTVIAQSGAIVTPATATTNAMWKIFIEIVTRLNGATGALFAMGNVTMYEDAAPTFGTVANYGVDSPMGSAGVATPAAVTCDLTADTALSFTADWSAANAANTLQGHNYLLESLN